MDDEIRPKALMIPFDKFVILDILPPEQCKNVLIKMRDYVQHGAEPENLEAIEQIAFESMRSFMDETVRNYQKTVETNRANGRKGGRPRRTDGFSEKPKETDGFSEKPTETHENPNQNQNRNLNLNQTDTIVSERERDASASQSPQKSTRFHPPDIAEVEAYFSDKGGTAEQAQRFRDFYESNGWKVGKNPMKSWKAAASGWISRDREQQKSANKPRNKAFMASRPPEEAASAPDWMKDAARRRMKKKEEVNAKVQGDP